MENSPPGNFQELITNSHFIDWVSNPTPESEQYWQSFVQKNPSIRDEFEKARYVVKTLQRKRKAIDDDNVREIWDSIQSDLKPKTDNLKLFRWWRVAAAIAVIIGLAGLFYLNFDRQDIDYSKIAVTGTDVSDITLVMSDGSRKVFTAQQTSFSYSQSGLVMVDSTMLITEPNGKATGSHQEFNQLIIPFGKQSTLFLADGTEVILNSGSHVIYPVTFTGAKREIYLEGEAYLKVSHNAEMPFYVNTNEMNVRVLGTEFDVSAYAEENTSYVVLVNGSVEAQLNDENVLLQENERLTFRKSVNRIEKAVVDVREYISWKDGWMYCNNESIGDITKKLSRYYNLEFVFQNKNAEMLTMTGKLDLRSDYRNVLDVICFSAPVKYTEEEGRIIFNLK
ncbi:FecR family protein [Maribellus luteus]|uniref:FecR family protein n=1 Tax=Maribellus luteus TaxID=2305463 RepID=A0A399SZU2_9BACT|nr:FecR domain-containing protein [Maribellus luteus]RIJ47895.1 FecR family protein [Maribellus luteus]